MMRNNSNPAITGTLLWAGFVSAISFMEAWLKFRAPGITIPLGLGIGRLVFGALNKMELIFATVITTNFLYNRQISYWLNKWYYILPVLLLLVHTFWLLPALDTRAELIINGHIVPDSNLHIYCVVTELVKVICLFTLSAKLLKHR
jgi:hypothetical protein